MAFTELGVAYRHGADPDSATETINITASGDALFAITGVRGFGDYSPSSVNFNGSETLTERVANDSGGTTSNTDREIYLHDLDGPTATTADIVWTYTTSHDRRWAWVAEGPYDASTGPAHIDSDYETGATKTQFAATRTPAGASYGVLVGICHDQGAGDWSEGAGSTLAVTVHEDGAVAGTQGPDAFIASDPDLGPVASETVEFDQSAGNEFAAFAAWYAPAAAAVERPEARARLWRAGRARHPHEHAA